MQQRGARVFVCETARRVELCVFAHLCERQRCVSPVALSCGHRATSSPLPRSQSVKVRPHSQSALVWLCELQHNEQLVRHTTNEFAHSGQQGRPLVCWSKPNESAAANCLRLPREPPVRPRKARPRWQVLAQRVVRTACWAANFVSRLLTYCSSYFGAAGLAP